jgi:cytochrome c
MKKIALLLAACLSTTLLPAEDTKPAKAETIAAPTATKAKSDPAKTDSKKKDADKKEDSDKKKEAQKPKEEKPSPEPSGPQSDGPFRKVILDVDEKKGEKYEDTLKDPMELAVADDGRVFVIERGGVIKLWRPESKTTVEIGKLEVFTELEDGLLGIALDPNFSKNGWVYLNYSIPVSGKDQFGKKCGTNRVSRFTFDGTKVDLGSERKLIDILTQREQCCHAGGSLTFDSQGNLYISTGDNTNPFDSDGFAPIDERKDRAPWDAQKSSANLADLRGKILRIHPQPDGTVAIPDGNLRISEEKPAKKAITTHPAQALLWTRKTQTKQKETRPEIYVMGCRNPFRISVDKKTGYVYWGDVGPDAKEFKEHRGPAGMDEVNQAREAGFFGWPYFVGENKPYWKRDFRAKTNALTKVRFDLKKPVNRSPNNTGLSKLPPPQPAMIFYPNSPSTKFPVVNGEGGRTAMAGPVYYFNPNLKSDRKLPKEFDHTLFIYDWSRSWIIAVHLDQNEKIATMERFCPKMTFKRPMDLELGSDGCLYLIEWGTAWGSNKDTQLVRIEYSPDASSQLAAEATKK